MSKTGKDYNEMMEKSRSAVKKNEAEFILGLRTEEYIREHAEPEMYIGTINPVILAAGANTRLGQVSKPLQDMVGTPSIKRIINQLKSAGFAEESIYVVTKVGTDYRSAPFWYFSVGEGRELKINNVSFCDADKGRAQVLKKFAEGEVEEAKYGYDGWRFVKKRPELKKNMLVLAADDVFFSDAPLRWFVDSGGEALNERSEGYRVFEMFGMRGEKHTEGGATADFDCYIVPDVAAYAFDRKAYNEVEIPEGKVSISNFVCEEMEKKGHKGDTVKMYCHFFNANDAVLYNTAIYAELYMKGLCNPNKTAYTEKTFPSCNWDGIDLKEMFGVSDRIRRITAPRDKGIKERVARAARESGLEGHVKEHGLRCGSDDDYDIFEEAPETSKTDWAFLYKLRYRQECKSIEDAIWREENREPEDEAKYEVTVYCADGTHFLLSLRDVCDTFKGPPSDTEKTETLVKDPIREELSKYILRTIELSRKRN
jgi:hypothetical protein